LEEREDKPNPFAEFAGRVARVPARAIQLPFQLAHEALQTPELRRQRAIEDMQRQQAEKLTGQPVPYSEGREWANKLTLGLVPGNPSAAVDPNQLAPAQQNQFQQMNPLMQALMQAKRPADYAALLANDDLFAEAGPDPLMSVPAGNRVVNERTGDVVLDPVAVPLDPTVVDKNEAAAEASRAGAEASGARADASRASAEKTRAEMGAVQTTIDLARKRIEKLDAEIADIQKGDPESGNSLKDRKDISALEKPVISGYMARVKDFDRGFTAARNAFNLFEMRGNPPPSQRRELEAMGFKDTGNREPRALQDLMLLVTAVRATDPPGRISDSEQKIYGAARTLFDPGIAEALAKGQTLTNNQRNELMVAVKKQTMGALQANDMAVVDARKSMLRDRVTGNGVGMNPLNVPDVGADLRAKLYPELGDQAAFPEADEEAEGLLEQLWAVAHPDGARPKDSAEFIDFVNSHGFRPKPFSR
jgi:hypothetical protein